MIYKIKELIGSNKNKKIYITGHSKGGAMAFLMACKVVMEGLPKPLVVTFGAPRVGDYEFATKYNIETYRYESFTDAVPHLPFTRDEKILISRLSPVYEKALDAVDSDAIKVIVGFKELSDYYPVGKYVRVDISHGKYSNIPKSINKDYGETLDSLCAVEWIVRQKNFDEITSSHTMDYKY
ncbi:MAG: lipase family protein [Clostridium sp.]|nr:lipase family protein [Clostridium sp.]